MKAGGNLCNLVNFSEALGSKTEIIMIKNLNMSFETIIKQLLLTLLEHDQEKRILPQPELLVNQVHVGFGKK